MEEEKLKNTSDALWRELNFWLLRAGLDRIDFYVTVIISLFDRTFFAFAKGDKEEKIKLYEKLLKVLNQIIDDLKEKNEIKREG